MNSRTRIIAAMGCYLLCLSSVFFTPHAGAGTAIVLASVAIFSVSIVNGAMRNRSAIFWAGLAGLISFAVILGASWEFRSDRRMKAAGGGSHVAHQIQAWYLMNCYFPLTRTVQVDGAIWEMHTIFRGEPKNYPIRQIPSVRNFATLMTSVFSLLVFIVAYYIASKSKLGRVRET